MACRNVASKMQRIEECLSAYQPRSVDVESTSRAAIALLLQPRADDIYVLFIHRAHHPKDPWSGHMAFPGGRHEPADPDLLITIQRETDEEVGIDLAACGEYLGRLEEVQAMAGGRQTGMIVSRFVYSIPADVRPVPDPVEVQDTIWVPLAFMLDKGAEQTVSRELQDGSTIDVEALLYGGKTIWGLTYRVLRDFLTVINN